MARVSSTPANVSSNTTKQRAEDSYRVGKFHQQIVFSEAALTKAAGGQQGAAFTTESQTAKPNQVELSPQRGGRHEPTGQSENQPIQSRARNRTDTEHDFRRKPGDLLTFTHKHIIQFVID